MSLTREEIEEFGALASLYRSLNRDGFEWSLASKVDAARFGIDGSGAPRRGYFVTVRVAKLEPEVKAHAPTVRELVRALSAELFRAVGVEVGHG